jgi:hypothetical protein
MVSKRGGSRPNAGRPRKALEEKKKRLVLYIAPELAETADKVGKPPIVKEVETFLQNEKKIQCKQSAQVSQLD